MWSRTALLIVTAAVLAGCHESRGSVANPAMASAETGSDAAIRTAIREHLAKNSNLNQNAFVTELKRVTLEGDRAEAEVEFHVTDGSGVMQLTYALAKQDDAWSVVESTPINSNFFHPRTAAGNGNSTAGSSIFRLMDNFHNGAEPTMPQLPSGHPPISPSKGDRQPVP